MDTTLPLEWFNATDAFKYYTFVLPFERHWNKTSATIWMQHNWTLSVWSSLVYIMLIFGGVRVMSHRKAFDLRWPLSVWNCALSIFSIVGFIRSSPEFFRALVGHGFDHSVCVPSYVQDSVGSFWMEAFVLSKLFELIDTAFIVLRKRPLIFLHWYHHVTVLVYCWHAMKDHTAAGRWFSWMNYAVHMIMYSYYAASALRYRPPRWISMCVTTLQLTQMITGCYLVYYVYTVKTYTPHRLCHQTWENLYFCFAIYSTYFLLFVHFFYKAYIDSSSRSKKTSANGRANGQASCGGGGGGGGVGGVGTGGDRAGGGGIAGVHDGGKRIDSPENHSGIENGKIGHVDDPREGQVMNGWRLRNGHHKGSYQNGSAVHAEKKTL